LYVHSANSIANVDDSWYLKGRKRAIEEGEEEDEDGGEEWVNGYGV
jgi:hypothetical protein